MIQSIYIRVFIGIVVLLGIIFGTAGLAESNLKIPSVSMPGGSISSLTSSPMLSSGVQDQPGVQSGDVSVLTSNSTTGTVTVVGAAPAFLNGWSYRKLHSIGGSPDGDLKDYQMRFVVWNTTGTDSGENVYVNTSVKSDFSDLRFTTIGGVQMPYWIETVNATAAVMWVKVPAIPRGGTQIMMYFGNAATISVSNGSATFDYFDDFEDGNTNGWTVDSGTSFTADSVVKYAGSYSGKYTHKSTTGHAGAQLPISSRTSAIVDYQFRPASSNVYSYGNLLDGTPASLKGTWVSFLNNGQIANYNNGWNNLQSYTAGSWYKMSLTIRSLQQYDVSINDVSRSKLQPVLTLGGQPSTYNGFWIHAYDPRTVAYIDDLRIRKYVPTAPVHSEWGMVSETTEVPVTNFTTDITSGYGPLSVQFTDQSSGATSWSWSFGDGTSNSTEQHPVHTFSAGGPYTVTLTATNKNGSDTIQKVGYISVQSAPVFPDDWKYVKTHTITSPGGTLTDYQIRIVASRTETGDTGEKVYLGTNAKSDYSDVRFASGSDSPLPYWIESVNSTAAVFWVKMPEITPSGSTLKVYYGNPSTVTTSSGSSTFDYFDDFEDGNTNGWTVDSGTSFTADSVVKYAGSYSGKYTHKSTTGHTGAQFPISSRTSAIVDYQFRPASSNVYSYGNLLDGTPASLKGTWVSFLNNGQIANYNNGWNNLQSYTAGSWYKMSLTVRSIQQYDVSINDVSRSTLQPVLTLGGQPSTYNGFWIHAYDPGTVAYIDDIRIRKYAAIAPVHGGWSSESGINDPPVVQFTADVTSGYGPLSVQFTDQSSGATSWSWSFGDGTSNSTEQHPIHTFSAGGPYTVTLTATNKNGSDTIQKVGYISVQSAPVFPDDWKYVKTHTITSPGGTLTDHQIRIVASRTETGDTGEKVYLGTNAKSDYSDVRFASGSDSPLPYWIESVNSTAAVFWVKMPEITPSGSTLKVYYGNPSTVTTSSGSSTFDYFDDFEDGNTNGWTVDSGTSFTADSVVKYAGSYSGKYTHKSTTGHAGAQFPISSRTSAIVDYQFRPASSNVYSYGNLLDGTPASLKGTWVSFLNNGQIANYNNGWNNLQSYTAGSWYKMSLTVRSIQQYDVSINDVSRSTLQPVLTLGGQPSTYNGFWIHAYDPGTVAYIDDIRIRKYAAIAPVHGGWSSESGINDPPVVQFTADVTSGYGPLSVQFTDQSSGATSWSWSFGDGTSNSTEQHPVHTFSAGGPYTVTLTATNKNGSDTIQKVGYISVQSAPVFPDDWKYVKTHTITSPGGTLTDYQIRIVASRTETGDTGEKVYLGTNAKSDYSDVRFASGSDSPLPYWIESVNSTAAVFWVKMPEITPSGSTLKVYYGNPSTVTTSSGSSTFDYFDDFEDGNTNGWTVDSGTSFTADSVVKYAGSYSGKYTHKSTTGHAGAQLPISSRTSAIVDYQFRPASSNVYSYGNLLDGTPASLKGSWVSFLNNGQIANYNNGWNNLQSYTAGSWYKMSLTVRSMQQYDVSINDVSRSTLQPVLTLGGQPSTYNGFWIHAYDPGTVAYIDDIRIRKYAAIAPVHGGWS